MSYGLWPGLEDETPDSEENTDEYSKGCTEDLYDD